MKHISNYLTLLALFFITPISARVCEDIVDQSTIEIAPEHLFVPHTLKGIRLFHDKDGFTVIKNGKAFPIKNACIDKELRGLSHEALDFLLGLKAKVTCGGKDLIFTKISSKQTSTLMSNIENSHESLELSQEDTEEIMSQLPRTSSYIKVVQYTDGEYGLYLMTRLVGGGPLGAAAGC